MTNIRKISFIALILILFFTQGTQYFIQGQDLQNEESVPTIVLGNTGNVTNGKAVITVDQTLLDQIVITLPKNVKYNEKETKNLSKSNIIMNYDASNHVLNLYWNEDIEEQQATFVLTEIENEYVEISAVGIKDGEIVVKKQYTMNVIPVNKEEHQMEAQEDKINDHQTSDEDGEIIEGSSNEGDGLKEHTEATKVQQMNYNPQNITPFSGNLNVDIDISPQQTTVLSGNAALYKLVLKVTGSKTEYTNAKIIVDLPITDFTSFTQDINDLIIDGVTPTYDEVNHQLIYEFDSIRSGRSYETLINVKTENLISPHHTQLRAQASFEADNQEKIVDDATVRINASSSISVSKKYKETRLSGNVQKAPFPGSYTIWDMKVSIPKKDVGQMLLKEGSKIVITDTFSSGLTYYDVMNNTPEPTVSGRTLTWEFDAPSIAEQMEADGEFFTVDLRVRLQVNNNNNLIGTTQENNVHVSATFIDDNTISESTRDTITIVSQDAATGDIEGSWYIPVHIGPSNGNGGLGNNDLKNPNPIVYDDALLAFSHGIAPLNESKHGDFQQYTTIYRIDPNLIFVKLSTPKGFYYRPNSSFPAKIPLVEQPRFNIVAQVNGEERVLVENAEMNREYTRSDLGLLQTDNISYIKYDFTYAPSGMLNDGRPNYYFYVTEGYTGEVVNTFNVYGQDANGNSFNYRYHQEGRNTSAGPRSATIAPRPTNQPPIATVGIELLDHDGGEVIHGKNRMKVTLSNNSVSTIAMKAPLESVVLLPFGVTLNEHPNPTYTDNDGRSSGGSYEILHEDYNGSGRQLVKIKWNDDRIRIGKNLTAELDVTISDSTPNTIQFDVYGFSGEDELRVPATSGEAITDTILQTDEDDLNGDGITNQPRLKSGNIYAIRGQYDIQTEKLVKGELDDDFTYFGHTTPNGSIAFQVKLTNTTGVDITKMTLMDVLPSVGDLGITDNIDRGSQFTPKMTNSIVFPAEWEEKVNVYYSTAKNPKRDDLTKNTKYPGSTTQLTNPAGAEEPNWMSASEVTDWSTIHSFKIELKEGVEWIKGQDMMIQFSMQAPSELEVDRDVLDSTIEPTARAAWNSFAVATEHGQPVEPLRVGVYMDYDIEDPVVEKTVNDQTNPVDLIDREEQFTWEVDYRFGNYTGNWNSVVFSDQIHELLEIIDVKIVDQHNEDVSMNGELDITDNLVTFTLNKKDGSFDYLKDQTYTLIIESKIKSTVTDEELEPFIHSGGIPNQAELSVDDEPILSNEVKVRPPVLGDIHIIKVDESTGEVLQGAEFELWKCPEAESGLDNCEPISTGISNVDGAIAFVDLQMGYYKLVETKAPEGYRLLKKPLEIELLDEENRSIELEVENSLNRWELPKTGGIGTVLFYGIGLVLMITASIIFFISKNKKLVEK